MHSIVELLVSCNTSAEAEKIGKRLMKERLIACFDIHPRSKTMYFWPPQKNKIKTGKGCMLIAATLPGRFAKIEHVVQKIHSDKTPFIGALTIEHVTKSYYNWLVLELK